jgi:exodeoxyribonuclease-3
VRVATWNVNSLKARLPRVLGWLESARPDVLLVQETKLHDGAAPVLDFRAAGYELAHHGEGRWNGVAIVSRVGLEDIRAGFGIPGSERDEARFLAARCGPLQVASVYAPNGRALESEFYAAKLQWFDRLLEWLRAEASPDELLVIGGDLNVAPEDRDVWDPAAFVGATHVSGPERAAFARLLEWGLVDAYRLHHPESGRFTWWDYRAGAFHKGMGMRIDHLLVTQPIAEQCTAAEIDRNARKGPQPSDHAPVWIDLAA